MEIFLTSKQINDFFRHVNKTETCWLWINNIMRPNRTKPSKPRRYGAFNINREVYSAHVISYIIHNGSFVDYDAFNNRLYVLHTCDVSLCVNPKHLYLGTNSKNMEDWQRRGKNANSSFTEDQVREIRYLTSKNVNLSAIARHYKVYSSTISNIKFNLRYQSILGEKECDITPFLIHNNMKITHKELKEILELLKDPNVIQAAIADKYGLSPSRITDIKKGRFVLG